MLLVCTSTVTWKMRYSTAASAATTYSRKPAGGWGGWVGEWVGVVAGIAGMDDGSGAGF
jgi:hypothetical protein